MEGLFCFIYASNPYFRSMAESKQEIIELFIKKGMPFTTVRDENGVKTIYSYLPVSYSDHPISGLIIENLLYDRTTYKLSNEYFYVTYEEFSLSAFGFEVPE
jgi:hypothetical protein